MSSLEVLQRKSVGARCVTLCPTMDLVAIVNEEGSLTLFRTFSWEKVCIKSASEITTTTSRTHTMTFSPSGKLLALGHESGEVSIVQIESGAVEQAHKFKADTNNGAESSVLRMEWNSTTSWGKFTKAAGYDIDSYSHLATIAEKVTLDAKADLDASELGEEDEHVSLFQSTQDTALFVLQRNGLLTAYLCGTFPLFAITTHLSGSKMTSCAENVLVPPFVSICDGQGSVCVGHLAVPLALWIPSPSQASTGGDCKIVPSTAPRLIYLEQLLQQYQKQRDLQLGNICPNILGLVPNRQQVYVAATILKLKAQVAGMYTSILTCSRKWKEACKTVLPKLGLLQTVLDGYQIKMSPIKFLYTVCQAGPWHPAAVLALTQHYNEQGLNRLRSSIDSTTNFIIKILQSRIQSMATSVLLQCRGLREVLDVTVAAGGPAMVPCSALTRLSAKAEQILFKLDDTIHEARSARDAFLLYIQFLKEFSLRANNDDTVDSSKKPKWDPRLGAQYMNLFDPRKGRAAGTGKHAQAEHVTGTYLFALLQDSELPVELAINLQSRCGATDQPYLQHSVSKHRSSSSHRETVSGLLKSLALQEGVWTGDDAASAPPLGATTTSLAQQVKDIKNDADSILHDACKHVNSHFLSCLQHKEPTHGIAACATLPAETSHALQHWLQDISVIDLAVVPTTLIRDPNAASVGEEGESDEEEDAHPTIVLEGSTFAVFMRHSKLYVLCAVPRVKQQEEQLLLSIVSSVQGTDDDAEPIGIDEVTRLRWVVGTATRPHSTHSMSLLCAMSESETETSQSILLKLDMRDLNFSKVTSAMLIGLLDASPALTSENSTKMQVMAKECDQENTTSRIDDKLQWVKASTKPVPVAIRSLALQNVEHLEVSGPRGVAAVTDAMGKLVVVDLELDSWGERYE